MVEPGQRMLTAIKNAKFGILVTKIGILNAKKLHFRQKLVAFQMSNLVMRLTPGMLAFATKHHVVRKIGSFGVTFQNLKPFLEK